jgi:spore coat protein U-like protein
MWRIINEYLNSGERAKPGPFACLVGLTVAVTAQGVRAESTASTIAVGATVTSNCIVSTEPISFGSIDVTSGTSAHASGKVAVTCTGGTAWIASANAGSGAGASLATRKMTGAEGLLSYELHVDNSRSAVWGEGLDASTSVLSGVGSGSAQTKPVYGSVPAGQVGTPPGTYSDLVVVTITY